MVLYSGKTMMARANATRKGNSGGQQGKWWFFARVMEREVPERVTMMLGDGSR